MKKIAEKKNTEIKRWKHIEDIGGDCWVLPIWRSINVAVNNGRMIQPPKKFSNLALHVSTRLTLLPYTRLFLRELRHLGKLLEGSLPTEEVRCEVRDFLGYLMTIANTRIVQEGGSVLQPAQFLFRRRYLNIQVVLFAIYKNVQSANIRPYVKRVKQGLKQGVDIFYLLASQQSMEFLRLVEKDVDRRLVKKRILEKTSDRTYMLRKSARKAERHRCLIYRRLEAMTNQDIDSIFEDMPPDDAIVSDDIGSDQNGTSEITAGELANPPYSDNRGGSPHV
jgi:hypothetical protein